MKSLFLKYFSLMDKLRDIPLLILRAVLVYNFYKPAIYKITDFQGTTEWFESLGIPLPALNAYLSGFTEMSGVILLTLGLGTRIIAIPMIIVMIVAIFTVHIENGFNASRNGIELPLYFMIMLFTLIVYGSGRISLDYLIKRKRSNSNK